MQKKELKKLALLGLTSGLLMAQTLHGKECCSLLANSGNARTSSTTQDSDPNSGNLGYYLMTEDELLIELSADGARMYQSLDAPSKAMALKVASMRCKATNPCKGFNACADDQHSCAGKGECRGKGKCGISDKNLAVKLVYDKMAAKRAKAGNR